MLKDHGVRVLRRDPLEEGLALEQDSLDAVTSFDSMEHWHRSPKALFREVVRTLKPGGILLLGTPNAANLRKRVEAVLGRTEWSSMNDWYEQPIFRGHVREPTVHDYRYIARDLDLQDVSIIGRNFAGLEQNGPVRYATLVLDPLLRAFPTLSSNLYLIGRAKS